MSARTDASISVVTWNVEWRQTRSPAAEIIRQRIRALNPDVVCLTESHADFLQGSGHVIEAEADYGYPLKANRRKVLLWSKEPWREIDQVGHSDLPSGRFIRGITSTAIAALTCVGVCIPWAGAHVTTGRRDRKRWEDHLTYLSALKKVLASVDQKTIILGDFNQAIPRRKAPNAVFGALETAVLHRFEVATSGLIEPLEKFAIDHIAQTADLRCTNVTGISAFGPAGEKLSDHFGLAATLRNLEGAASEHGAEAAVR
jgi:endonuclease/exonuclease/phosphatase family metal-dependent hydrolase